MKLLQLFGVLATTIALASAATLPEPAIVNVREMGQSHFLNPSLRASINSKQKNVSFRKENGKTSPQRSSNAFSAPFIPHAVLKCNNHRLKARDWEDKPPAKQYILIEYQPSRIVQSLTTPQDQSSRVGRQASGEAVSATTQTELIGKLKMLTPFKIESARVGG